MAAPDDGERFGERIQVDEGGEWTCLCRNQAHLDGFTTCTAEGRLVEPVVGGEWDGRHYLCLCCGRIIDQETLRVTGTASGRASAAPPVAARSYSVAMYEDGYAVGTRGELEACTVAVADVGDDERAMCEEALRLGAARRHPEWQLRELTPEPLPSIYRLEFAASDGVHLHYLGTATRRSRE
jgi:hypothetical protein